MPLQYSPPQQNNFASLQGNFAAKIIKADWQISRAGNDMVVVTLKISGHYAFVKHWIANSYAIQRFCDAFSLDPYSVNSDKPELISSWIGQIGGINLSLEKIKNGTVQRVKPLTHNQTLQLPPFVDIPKQQAQNSQQQYQPPQQQYQQQAQMGNFEQYGFNNTTQQQPQQNQNSQEIPF